MTNRKRRENFPLRRRKTHLTKRNFRLIPDNSRVVWRHFCRHPPRDNGDMTTATTMPRGIIIGIGDIKPLWSLTLERPFLAHLLQFSLSSPSPPSPLRPPPPPPSLSYLPSPFPDPPSPPPSLFPLTQTYLPRRRIFHGYPEEACIRGRQESEREDVCLAWCNSRVFLSSTSSSSFFSFFFFSF